MKKYKSPFFVLILILFTSTNLSASQQIHTHTLSSLFTEESVQGNTPLKIITVIPMVHQKPADAEHVIEMIKIQKRKAKRLGKKVILHLENGFFSEDSGLEKQLSKVTAEQMQDAQFKERMRARYGSFIEEDKDYVKHFNRSVTNGTRLLSARALAIFRALKVWLPFSWVHTVIDKTKTRIYRLYEGLPARPDQFDNNTFMGRVLSYLNSEEIDVRFERPTFETRWDIVLGMKYFSRAIEAFDNSDKVAFLESLQKATFHFFRATFIRDQFLAEEIVAVEEDAYHLIVRGFEHPIEEFFPDFLVTRMLDITPLFREGVREAVLNDSLDTFFSDKKEEMYERFLVIKLSLVLTNLIPQELSDFNQFIRARIIVSELKEAAGGSLERFMDELFREDSGDIEARLATRVYPIYQEVVSQLGAVDVGRSIMDLSAQDDSIFYRSV